jgi:hypothetical protein
MAIEYTTEQHGLICNLLHQAICEQRPEPDFDPEALGFTGPAERAFALAILEDVLGMRWDLTCPDCQGYDPEDYIVTAEVWAAAGLEPDSGWFHLACLSCLSGWDAPWSRRTSLPIRRPMTGVRGRRRDARQAP